MVVASQPHSVLMRNSGIKYLLNISRTISRIDHVIREFSLVEALLIRRMFLPYFVKQLTPNFIRRSIYNLEYRPGIGHWKNILALEVDVYNSPCKPGRLTGFRYEMQRLPLMSRFGARFGRTTRTSYCMYAASWDGIREEKLAIAADQLTVKVYFRGRCCLFMSSSNRVLHKRGELLTAN